MKNKYLIHLRSWCLSLAMAFTFILCLVFAHLSFAQSQPVLVKDISPGPTNSYPEDFTAFGNKVHFRAYINNAPVEVWESDGTANGTVSLGALSPTAPIYPTVFKGTTYAFQKQNDTTFALTINNGAAPPTIVKVFPNQSVQSIIYPAEDIFYFVVGFRDSSTLFGGTYADLSLALWRSDGTTVGTREVAVLVRYVNVASNSYIEGVTSGNYFYNLLRVSEVCQSLNVCKGDTNQQIDRNCYPARFDILDSADGDGMYYAKSDNTYLLPTDIFRYTNNQSIKLSDSNAPLSIVGSTVGKKILNVMDKGLWLTDGTMGGTKRIFDSAVTYLFRNTSGNLLAVVKNGSTDGTNLWHIADNGVVKLNALSTVGASSGNYYPNKFLAVGNTLFFANYTPELGHELWKQDVTTIPNSGVYCAVKALSPWEEWITRVRFNTIDNTSEKYKDYQTLGYSNYLDKSTTVTKGQTYPLSITPAMSWSGRLPDLRCRVWIDYNHNYIFEDSEKVLEGIAQNLFTSNVLISTTAATGITRMRVILSNRNDAYPTPCDDFAKGEVEDYTINIQEGGFCIPNNVSFIRPCPNDTVVTLSTGTCAYVGWAEPLARDNCGTVYSFGRDDNFIGNCFPLGTTNVHYRINGTIFGQFGCGFTVTVQLGNQPDLTLSNLTIPTPSVQQGQTLNFNIDIKNIGTAAATGNFNVKAYISTDNILSANDVQDGNIPTGNFAAGFTASQVPGASTIPASLAAGQYYLILKVDADNQIVESNENNNVIVSTTPFTVTTGQSSGTYCASKGTAPWELWVSNVKLNIINNPSDKFRDFNTLGYSDYTNLTTVIGKGIANVLTITPGLSWSGNLPNVYCRAWIDYNGNKIFESSEMVFQNNNANPFTGNVIVPSSAINGNTRMRVAMKWGGYPEPCEVFAKGEVEDYSVNITEGGQTDLPDLTLANLTIPITSAQQGQILNFKIDLKNIGTGNAVGNFTYKAYFSSDNVLSANDVQAGIMTASDFTANYTATQVTGVLTVPTTLAVGQYSVIVKIDADNQITESNENNNVIASTSTITVTIAQTGGVYCVAKGTNPWEQWILAVWVQSSAGTYSFPRTAKEGYGNFTSVAPANMYRGPTHGGLISIAPQSSWNADPRNANMFWRIWIDLNQDNDFDDSGEMVGSRQVGISFGSFLDNDSPFTIPTTATLGKTRMRIAMKVGGYPTPCETFERGEVEDYSVIIMDAPTSAQPLMVFGNLKAQLVEAQIRLDWVQFSDKITTFTVEKSLDGQTFQSIKKVAVTPFDTYYYVYDTEPTEGGNFYRLKMNLNNGDVAYSNIQDVLYQKLTDFTVFPNPSSEEVFVELKAFENKTVNISISNLIGKIVFYQTIESVNRAPHRLDISELESGSYFIRVETKGKRAVVRKLQIMK